MNKPLGRLGDANRQGCHSSSSDNRDVNFPEFLFLFYSPPPLLPISFREEISQIIAADGKKLPKNHRRINQEEQGGEWKGDQESTGGGGGGGGRRGRGLPGQMKQAFETIEKRKEGEEEEEEEEEEKKNCGDSRRGYWKTLDNGDTRWQRSRRRGGRGHRDQYDGHCFVTRSLSLSLSLSPSTQRHTKMKKEKKEMTKRRRRRRRRKKKKRRNPSPTPRGSLHHRPLPPLESMPLLIDELSSA